MKIIVLMSTYNGEDYIREQIDSIFSQKGDFELEMWVRDDGSSDSTTEILQEYAQKEKIMWYQGENLKPAKSFLDVLKKCGQSDFYAFADQDDYWFEDKLKRGMERLKNIEQPMIYFSNAELVDKFLQPINRNVYRNTPTTNIYTIMCAANVLGCTMIFNNALANLIREKSMPAVVTMHDSYLARVCAAVGGEIVYDKRVCMKYRQHESNVMGIKRGTVNLIIQRLKMIFERKDIGIAEQAEEILKNYSSIMPEESRRFMLRVANYKKNIFTRVSLACSRKTKYITKNMAFSTRMGIFLGNK